MSDTLTQPPGYYVERLRELQNAIRDALSAALLAQEASANENALAYVADERGGDTIYAIDIQSEEILFHFCEEWAKEAPLVLIAEGIEGNGWRIFPETAREEDAAFLLIVDPIDGTRNLMYNKRSAWVLSGIAPNRGRATTLADIQVAMMTELTTTRQHVSDQLWATVGGGAFCQRFDRLRGVSEPWPLRPSRASSLAHGFATIAKFFPAGKGAIAAFEEELFARVAPESGENPLVFDDEYISTGGQLYELMVGHDRFIADLRPVFFKALGLPRKLVCHPYDICVERIAREAGVIVTDEHGDLLNTPLDIQAPVTWVGYANPELQALIEPHLHTLLEETLLRYE